MKYTAQRLSPIARAAAIACLGWVANSAMATCPTTPITTNAAACTLLTNESVTISNTGSVSAVQTGGVYELAIDANGNGNVVTISAGGRINGFIAVSGAANGIDLVTNAGTIAGGLVGISLDSGGFISAIDNSGAITAQAGITANNGAVIQAITNTGTITGTADNGVDLGSLGNNTLTLSNTGANATITGTGAPFAGVYVSAAIDSISNSGKIEGLGGASGITVTGSVTSITNAVGGSITGGLAGIYVDTTARVGSITNAGTIRGTDISVTTAIDLVGAAGATTVTNTGLIFGDVLLGAGGTLNLNGTAGSVSGAVSGDAGSVVNVNGTYTSGGDYNVGRFNVATGGVLNLGHALTSTASPLSNAGTLNLNANASVTGAITGAGTLNVNTDYVTDGTVSAGLLSIASGSILDVGHAITVSTALNNAGTLVVNSNGSVAGAITGGGDVYLNTPFTTQGSVAAGLLTNNNVFNVAHTITVSSALENAGTLNLTGGARVVGAITGSGAVNANTNFSTEGTVNAGQIAIATAKALTVQHAVTASTLTNAGTLNIAAGQTLHTGSYTQAAGGVLRVGANSTATPVGLAVSGAANFSASGAIAVNVSAGDSLADNDVLRIVTAGTLTPPAALYSVTDNSAMWNFTALDNGANAIDLTVHFSSPTNAVQLASQPAAAGAADAISAVLSGSTPASMQALANILNAQNNQVSLGNQIAQLTPVLSGSQGVASLAAINAGASSLVQNQLTSTLGMASGEVVLAQHVWLKPFGSSLKQDASSDGIAGYRAATSGVAVGADGKIGSYGWRGGAALSYGNTKVDDSGSNQGALEISSWQFTGYGSHRIDAGTQFNLVGGIGFNDNKSTRYVPMLATTYSGKYNSWHVLLDAELEWAKKMSDSNTLIPSVRLSYSALNSAAYTETPSGNAALQVASNTTNALVLGLGTKFVRQQGALGRLIAHVDAGFDLVDKPTALSTTFEGGGPSFSTAGATPGRTLLKAGLAYQQTLTNGSELTARFDTEWRQLFAGNSLSLNWRHAF